MNWRSILDDCRAAVVVFLVALPLCLGIAVASGAPPMAGLLAGIVGGVVVGLLSGSATSVTGPAAGLTAVVLTQIQQLGSFEAFLMVVLLAGIFQILFGLCRAGQLGHYFPHSVINGLLAAIGLIIILKQVPHLVGYDVDPEGDMAFQQTDHENTFTEIWNAVRQYELGAAIIGIVALFILLGWDRFKGLKKSRFPISLVVVGLAILVGELFRRSGAPLAIEASHFVNVPAIGSLGEVQSFWRQPAFTEWHNPRLYQAALLLAIIASLETLLNVRAIDQIDPQQRTTPVNRELIAQGIGNTLAGLVGAIPVTAVIVRGTVNINAGARTKWATILHGLLLVVAVVLLPPLLNKIPLSALAAILIVTGLKLATPTLAFEMWRKGWSEFGPFVVTLFTIVFTDLLIGILVGLAVSIITQLIRRKPAPGG